MDGLLDADRCQRCSIPLPAARTLCPDCRLSPPPFERLIFYGRYRDELRDLIRLYKYSEVERLRYFMAGRLSDLYTRKVTDKRPVVIIPVPPDPGRKRRFYPIRQLARLVGRNIGLPISCGVLRKKRSTRPQTLLTGTERMSNLKNAFVLTKPRQIRKKHILLIDDVTTTQSTIRECARLLRKVDCRVTVMTVARTLYT
jgi:ComF family protein